MGTFRNEFAVSSGRRSRGHVRHDVEDDPRPQEIVLLTELNCPLFGIDFFDFFTGDFRTVDFADLLEPAREDTLYFVSRGDGSHQFSRTLGEHERAVTKYQRSGRR